MLLAWRRRLGPALGAVALALIVVNWVFVLKVLPSFEAYKPAPGLAAVLKERAGPDDLIVTYNVALPSLVYYLRRHIDVFYDHGPVLELLHSRRPLYLDGLERRLRPRHQARHARPPVPGELAAHVRRQAEERAVPRAPAGDSAADDQVPVTGSAAQGSGKIFEHVFRGFGLSPEP